MNKNSLILITLLTLIFSSTLFADELSLTTVFTPRCKGDNTSDWKTNDWCKDYYDISNLCPGEYGTGPSDKDRKGCANVVKDVKFGRWQKGTFEGGEINVYRDICDGGCDCNPPMTSCTASVTCPGGEDLLRCYYIDGKSCADSPPGCEVIRFFRDSGFSEMEATDGKCTRYFSGSGCGTECWHATGMVFAVCGK